MSCCFRHHALAASHPAHRAILLVQMQYELDAKGKFNAKPVPWKKTTSAAKTAHCVGMHNQCGPAHF